MSSISELFLRGRFSHAFFLVAVVVVCIVFPNKIALGHFASIMVSSSFEDFSMLLPFVKAQYFSTFCSLPFV